MRGIGAVVAEVDAIAAAIAGAVEQQNAATRGIAESAQRAARGTEQPAEGIGKPSAAVGGTRDAVEGTARAAEGLCAQGGQIGAAVDSLAARLRAA